MALKPSKRKGSPYYQITGTVGGERIRRSTKTALLSEAKDLCFQIEKEYRENTSGPLTVSHAIIEYSRHTGNTQYLKKVNETIGRIQLSSVTQDVIDKAARQAYGTYKRGPKGKPIAHSKATIKRQFYTPLAAVLHHAHDIGWIPYIRVKMPKTSRPAPQWATKEWFEKFNQFAEPELKALTVFLAGTGCRISEALNLRPLDVDILNQTAMVRATKNGLPREAYLPKFVISSILPYLEGETVFPYADRFAVNYRLEKTAKEAGIEYLSSHKVGSHTFATNLAKYGKMDAKALTETNRWKDPKSTYHYTHFLKREQASKAETLEVLFD